MEFDDRARRAWDHYKVCAAVHRFEEDEAVEKVAAVCAEIEKVCDAQASASQQWNGVQSVLSAVSYQMASMARRK